MVTTTFSIIAEGFADDGTALSDRDTITITVLPEDDAEAPRADEEPVYNMELIVEASEMVIAPGDSVDIDLLIIFR